MRGIVIVAAGIGWMTGCGTHALPTPELTPQAAAAAIHQKWAQGEMNHFKVTFHSDSLIECGVQAGLWKLTDVPDAHGNTWGPRYRLTEKGSGIMTTINLKESGKGHQIMLNGPYRLEIRGITAGSAPNTRDVAFRWDIDWDKASEDLKACLPRFELSGNAVAVFQREDGGWQFVSI